MDAYFQGRAYLNKGSSPEYLAEAQKSFARSLALDPQNAEAWAGAALAQVAIAASTFTDQRAARLVAAESVATKAVSLAVDNPLAHLALSVTYMLTDRAEQGIAESERVLELDRNVADAHAIIGWGKHYLGRAAETEAHIREALRLSPRDIFAFRWMAFAGAAKMALGADAEAVAWLRRSVEVNRNLPLAHFLLAAALALMGSLDEARASAKAGLALDPDFTIDRFRASSPSSNPVYLAQRERAIEGLRLTGLLEG
jgi:tetratricopeptide (TPR) repeat protein